MKFHGWWDNIHSNLGNYIILRGGRSTLSCHLINANLIDTKCVFNEEKNIHIFFAGNYDLTTYYVDLKENSQTGKDH